MYPEWRLAILVAGTCVTATAGPLGGGASTQLVMHLANNSVDPAFRADVGAKESNQDRVLGLVLVVTRYALLLAIGTDFTRTWAAVVALSVAHAAFNALCVRVLVLRVLNRARLREVLRAWNHAAVNLFNRWEDGFPSPQRIADELGPGFMRVLGPEYVAKHEHAILPERWWLGGGRPWGLGTIGVHVKDLVTGDADAHFGNVRPCPHGCAHGFATKEDAARHLLALHANERYVVGADLRAQRLVVVLKEGATDRDQLQAALQAHVAQGEFETCSQPPSLWEDDQALAERVVECIEDAHRLVTRHAGGSCDDCDADKPPEWPAFEAALRGAGWVTDRVLFSAEDWRLPPDGGDDDEDDEDDESSSDDDE